MTVLLNQLCYNLNLQARKRRQAVNQGTLVSYVLETPETVLTSEEVIRYFDQKLEESEASLLNYGYEAIGEFKIVEETDSNAKKLSTGAIVGIVVGALVGLAALVGVAYCMCCKNKKKTKKRKYAESENTVSYELNRRK